jgi:hypothetical protein
MVGARAEAPPGEAELKRDRITAYGADVRMETSMGSMSAVIEPANG